MSQERYRNQIAHLEGLTARLEAEVRDLKAQLVSKETSGDGDEDGQLAHLREEIEQWKMIVAVSNHHGPGTLDTSIQQDMNGLFCAVRDWTFNAVRRHKHKQITFSPSLGQKHLLAQYIRRYDERGDHEAQALMVIFSHHLVLYFERRLVFGPAMKGYMAHAAALYRSIQKIPGAAIRKRKWTALTNELLSRKDGTKSQVAKDICDSLVDLVKGEVESAYGLEAGSAIGNRLRSVIQPYIGTFHQLHHQEEEYHMRLLPVEEHLGFQSEVMEDMSYEDKNQIQYSLFPVIYKTMVSEDNEGAKPTIIFKAKVVTCSG